MELYLGTTYYGSGFILDGFMVLDIDNYVFSNTNDSYFLLMIESCPIGVSADSCPASAPCLRE